MFVNKIKFFLISFFPEKLRSNRWRLLRVAIIRYYVGLLSRVMEKIGFKQGILIYNNKNYIFCEGILLNTIGTNRYFKVVDDYGNEGRKINKLLKSRGVQINSMIDLGANFGELSLYFCKEYPHAKILAVEPSSDNFKILKDNKDVQLFNTSNLILLQAAVCDKKNKLFLTKGRGSENQVLTTQEANTEEVEADTLVSFFERFKFDSIDLLKIDIEGSEPLLYESIVKLINKIKVIMIEIGNNIPHDNYLPLLKLFFSSSFRSFYEEKEISFDEAVKLISGPEIVNLCFIKL